MGRACPTSGFAKIAKPFQSSFFTLRQLITEIHPMGHVAGDLHGACSNIMHRNREFPASIKI
jgi:hypothetical protein